MDRRPTDAGGSGSSSPRPAPLLPPAVNNDDDEDEDDEEDGLPPPAPVPEDVAEAWPRPVFRAEREGCSWCRCWRCGTAGAAIPAIAAAAAAAAIVNWNARKSCCTSCGGCSPSCTCCGCHMPSRRWARACGPRRCRRPPPALPEPEPEATTAASPTKVAAEEGDAHAEDVDFVAVEHADEDALRSVVLMARGLAGVRGGRAAEARSPGPGEPTSPPAPPLLRQKTTLPASGPTSSDAATGAWYPGSLASSWRVERTMSSFGSTAGALLGAGEEEEEEVDEVGSRTAVVSDVI
jgi:hypothetical protein